MKGLIFFVFVLGLLISAPPVSSCNPVPSQDQETTTQLPQDDDDSGSGQSVPDQEPQDDDVSGHPGCKEPPCGTFLHVPGVSCPK